MTGTKRTADGPQDVQKRKSARLSKQPDRFCPGQPIRQPQEVFPLLRINDQGLHLALRGINRSLRKYNRMIPFVARDRMQTQSFETLHDNLRFAREAIADVSTQAKVKIDAQLNNILKGELLDMTTAATADEYWYTRANILSMADSRSRLGVLDNPNKYSSKSTGGERPEPVQPLPKIQDLRLPVSELNKSLHRYNSILAFVPSQRLDDEDLQDWHFSADSASRRMNEIFRRAEAECKALTESIFGLDLYPVMAAATSDDYWYTRADLLSLHPDDLDQCFDDRPVADAAHFAQHFTTLLTSKINSSKSAYDL